MDEQYQGESYPVPSTGGGVGHAVEQLAYARRQKAVTVREQLAFRIDGLKAQLASHEAALATLDETPGIEKVLDALRKTGV